MSFSASFFAPDSYHLKRARRFLAREATGGFTPRAAVFCTTGQLASMAKSRRYRLCRHAMRLGTCKYLRAERTARDQPWLSKRTPHKLIDGQRCAARRPLLSIARRLGAAALPADTPDAHVRTPGAPDEFDAICSYHLRVRLRAETLHMPS